MFSRLVVGVHRPPQLSRQAVENDKMHPSASLVFLREKKPVDCLKKSTPRSTIIEKKLYRHLKITTMLAKRTIRNKAMKVTVIGAKTRLSLSCPLWITT